MLARKIELGEWYRHKNTPDYGWAKALKVLQPKQDENTNSYIVVKCQWGTDKGDVFGFIKYFLPRDLIAINSIKPTGKQA